MISREEAIKIAEELHGTGFKFYGIEHGAAQISASMAYLANARKWRPDDVWCVTCSSKPEQLGLFSCRAIVVCANTGKILYDGSANDEG